MKLIARDYQVEAVNSVFTYFNANKGNPLVAMPTGTGKSVVIAMFLESVYQTYPTQRIILLTHVQELIEQNYEKLRTLWPNAPAGIYSAGLNKRDYTNRITFAGIGSVAKKASLFKHIDLVLIDEAHLVSSDKSTMYMKFINDLKTANPFLKVIGFTATPWRLGQGHLTQQGIFTDVCFDITAMNYFNRLINEGYLIPLIPRKPKYLLDVEGVKLQGGEYVQSQLQQAVDKAFVTHSALQEVLQLGADRNHWLIFSSGVEHAHHIMEMLQEAGIPTTIVHSDLPDKERVENIKGFKEGKYRAIVNNNVLTTGFDFPGIDLIAVLRPTMSTVLWVQMLGRGTRPVYAEGFDLTTIEGRLQAIQNSPKQNCLVLDFANNTSRLGPINDPVIPRKKGEKGGVAPVKLCNVCDNYNHASARTCVYCGSEFPLITKIKAEASTNALIKDDAPITEDIKVDYVTYLRHEKRDAGTPPTMRVTYYCHLRSFTEYICFEHQGLARHKAKRWWKEHAGDIPCVDRVNDALAFTDVFKTPTHIRVWTNKKYPEILAACFDGTCFGTIEPEPVQELPVVNNTPTQDYPWSDDEIPF